jgi:effector-binding domain-containing protein
MAEKKLKKIKHKKLKDKMVATAYFNLKERKEIKKVLDDLKKNIPEEYIMGPGFAIFRFITSFKEGFDIEAGFPVSKVIENDKIKTRIIPKIEVLSLTHRGQEEKLGESYGKLYGYAYEHGLISDEFCREVYHDSDSSEGASTEIQFVIHKWDELFAKNLQVFLGDKEKREITKGINDLKVNSTVKERFNRIKEALERLQGIASEEQMYKILSGCAHIFPRSQIKNLKAVYDKVNSKTGNPLQAIDAVIEFMGNDPGWGKRPNRMGKIIYSSKNPRNPEKYKKAKSKLEKKKAYCFCPIIRENLECDMPYTFCYCGAGWYKQQWEGTIEKSVKIEIVKSILKGDELCRFAIHLPDDL